jgi:hypothetical protein
MHKLPLRCVNLGQCAQLVNAAILYFSYLLAHFVASWIQTPDGVDLTRSQLYESSKSTIRVIPVNGNDRSLTVDTRRTVLVIIDMQSESI